ncbi:MAG: dienelactone hydrolase [Halieaceae bacterium]|nr:dienelactone hydrolase [Halieaceae bacterium]
MSVTKRWITLLFVIVLLLSGVGYLRFNEAWNITPLNFAAVRNQVVPHIQVVLPGGDGPHPAVLMFHGCGGVKPALLTRAHEFADRGYGAVVVDSFKGRDIDWQRVCDGEILYGDQRAADVLVGLDFVRRDSRFDASRLFLAGYSHGGWTVLESVFYNGELPRGLLDAPDTSLDGVRGVVAWYPYCGVVARFRGGWQAQLPVLMLLAGEDQITPAEPCVDVARSMASGGQPVDWRVFEDAAHGFDTTHDWVRGYDAEIHAEARAIQNEFFDAL